MKHSTRWMVLLLVLGLKLKNVTGASSCKEFDPSDTYTWLYRSDSLLDDSSFEIPLPFPIRPYSEATSSNSIFLSTNGYFTFHTGSSNYYGFPNHGNQPAVYFSGLDAMVKRAAYKVTTWAGIPAVWVRVEQNFYGHPPSNTMEFEGVIFSSNYIQMELCGFHVEPNSPNLAPPFTGFYIDATTEVTSWDYQNSTSFLLDLSQPGRIMASGAIAENEPTPTLSVPVPSAAPTAAPTPLPNPTAAPTPLPNPTAAPTPNPTAAPTPTPTAWGRNDRSCRELREEFNACKAEQKQLYKDALQNCKDNASSKRTLMSRGSIKDCTEVANIVKENRINACHARYFPCIAASKLSTKIR